MTDTIDLRSDNGAGVSDEILAALAGANRGAALAYGADEVTERLQDLVRTVFEHDGARCFPVPTGTAANAVGLSALTPPWGAVLCHESAHILNAEAGATSMFSGGAVMRGVGGEGSKMSTGALEAALASVRWGDPHESQPAALSVTNVTDRGAVYAPHEIAALAGVAARRGLRVHLDGARLANAIVAAGGTPADMTWRAGVEVVSLGATKNGAMSTDAIVSFDPAVSEALTFRLKRAGHVLSKMRYASAQLEAYLTDGRWLRTAAHANAAMAQLVDGLRSSGATFLVEPQANMAFVRIAAGVPDRLAAGGLRCHRTAPDVVRFVASFQTTRAEVDAALSVWRAATSLPT